MRFGSKTPCGLLGICPDDKSNITNLSHITDIEYGQFICDHYADNKHKVV